jgi:hypothetical protein
MWAQTLGRVEPDEVDNTTFRNWVRKLGSDSASGAGRFKGVWLELWRAAADNNFPAPLESCFTDGGIGPHDRRQYPDLPTHLNINIRAFDVVAAQAGSVAIAGGTVPGTQLLLTNPDVPGAVPFVTSGPLNAPPAAGPSSHAHTFFEQSFWHQVDSALSAPEPASLPTQISVILTPAELNKTPFKNVEEAGQKTEDDMYWTYYQIDLTTPRARDFYRMWKASKLLQRLYYFESQVYLQHSYVYLHEWVSNFALFIMYTVFVLNIYD